MKINFKQPRYLLPLLALPFTFLGFYVYQDLFAKEEEVILTSGDGLQENIAPPSREVTEKKLSDKLDTYQKHFKQADGYTAISGLETEESEAPGFEPLYSEAERRRLDSLEAVLKEKAENGQVAGHRFSGESFPSRSEPLSETDKALLELLNQNKALEQQEKAERTEMKKQEKKEEDPLALMRAQYALIDSFQKANDPEYRAKAEREVMQKALEEEQARMEKSKMHVGRADQTSQVFNTLKPQKDNTFIKAIIDEDVTGYAGYRIRLRLLEDIVVGNTLIVKGTCLYATINSFSAQRVTFSIQSVFYNDRILPVDLDVYDLDGMKGLYVPESAFREFTRELGGNSFQGMNMTTSGTQEQSRFLMSSLQKAFQSTSQAIAQSIRKNKAKIKYSTYVYLIDSRELSKTNTQQKQTRHENID
ncbi:MAG: conjugative transposon protein TraM [Mangrovibacterium sp.]